MSDPLWAPLVDGHVLMALLGEHHRSALASACAEDRDIWGIYSISFDPLNFDKNFTKLVNDVRYRPYAVTIDGRVVGMTSYIDPDQQQGVVEIGMTYIVPKQRGTGLNDKMKRLMIGHAFASGYRRVEFRVDQRNERSQAAMEKIGGVREGLLRQERVTWTGYVRDTVIFSILRDEWMAKLAEERAEEAAASR